MNQIALPPVIGYYEAMEILLQNARKIGEHRTHFGLLHQPTQDHCFIRNVSLPNKRENIPGRLKMQASMRSLEDKLFRGHLENAPMRIADIGCGTGGTLNYLGDHYPQHELTGVNINAVQFQTARNYLAHHQQVELYQTDFFNFYPSSPFDLLYFVESAFHFSNKEALCKKIAQCLEKGGELFMVDIFQEEQLYQRLSNRQPNQLFSYLSVSRWKELLEAQGLVCTDYENISDPIANYCKITTTEQTFLEGIVPEIVPTGVHLGQETINNFKLVYHGYKRLSRQLKKGTLEYGILRFTKRPS